MRTVHALANELVSMIPFYLVEQVSQRIEFFDPFGTHKPHDFVLNARRRTHFYPKSCFGEEYTGMIKLRQVENIIEKIVFELYDHHFRTVGCMAITFLIVIIYKQ